MKVGDLVRYKNWESSSSAIENRTGVIIKVDDSHRQKTATVLNSDGFFVERVWIGHIEVVNNG